MQQVSREALQASLGCGNPTRPANYILARVVLDLGSGGGSTSCFRKRVGPAGKAYGFDLTDEMLARR